MQNKGLLLDKLESFVQENIEKRELIDRILRELLSKHGIIHSQAIGKLNNVRSLSEEELYCITNAIDTTLAVKSMPGRLGIDRFFSKEEQDVFETYQAKKAAQTEIYPIKIPFCQIVDGRRWQTVVTARMLAELNDKQLITYNPDTQRQQSERTINGVTIMENCLVDSSVKEIQEQMANNTFISNAITFNINVEKMMNNYSFTPDINENIGTLTLHSGTFDIIDGYHRFRALMANCAYDPNFNYVMQLNIMNCDTATARRYIVQEDKRNPINASYIKMIDPLNPARIIPENLNSSFSSRLYQKIGDEQGKVSFTDMLNWVGEIYNLHNQSEAFELQKKLMSLFNALIDGGADYNSWDRVDLGIILYSFHLHEGPEVIEVINKCMEHKDECGLKASNAISQPNVRKIKDFINRFAEK